MRHYHVAVSLNGQVIYYTKFDSLEDSAMCFIQICKQLVDKKIGPAHIAFAQLMEEAEEENFFVSSTGSLYVVGWLDCWEGSCATRFWN